MEELKKYLLSDRDDDIAENVIRRLLTYGLGRTLTYRDRFVVEELLGKSKAAGHGLQEMIVSVCTSDTFRTSTRDPKTQ